MVIMRERNVDKDEIGRIDENEKEMWIKMK